MKKKKYAIWLSIIAVMILISGCQSNKYKRINIQGEPLGDENCIQNAKVESLAKETYSDKMPIYEITPRPISIDEFKQFAAYLGLTDPIRYIGDCPTITNHFDSFPTEWYTLDLKENAISYQNYRNSEKMCQTDEELEALAKEVFATLPLIENEYEYLGETSTQTLTLSDVSYVVKRRFSFRRLIDHTRVIGEDICDIYLDAQGLCGIEIRLFTYNCAGEIDMLSLSDAVKRVKNPDAFSLQDEDAGFTGHADTLCIEKTKLLFVNQYSDGCEILQPVYNLMGTATNENGSAEFSAKIIAIPEKYTHD